MTYSTGGLIQAADYNGFCGSPTANISGELNTVLSTGKGNAGYGQTLVSNVTVAGTVTAAQWSTLVSAVNVVRKHQAGATFTNLSSYTAGTVINATQNVSGNATTAYTNRLVSQAAGTTTTGSTFFANFSSVNTTSALTFSFSRTATFASADQARYFFNAGGALNFVVIGATNNDGTQRTQDLANLAATNFTSMRFTSANNSGRTGTGATLSSSDTNLGYYKATTSNASAVLLTSTQAAYTSDTCNVVVRTNGVQGSNSDNGTVMTLSMILISGAQSPAINDSVNVAISHRIDVIYPSTTFLANTWGSVTIA